MSDAPIGVTTEPVSSSTRRLRASWSLNPDQNLVDLHASEMEVFQAMSEEIAKDLNHRILEIARQRWRRRELELLGRITAREITGPAFWATVRAAERLCESMEAGDKGAEDVLKDLIRENGLPAAYGEARWRSDRLRKATVPAGDLADALERTA